METDEKKYARIALQLDPIYAKLLVYIEIVKNFIIDKGGIIYGGTAIDYALRLKGDSIYSEDELTVPDLDFYLPDSVNLSYLLAAMLFENGAESRSILAMHVETMRVDCGQHHFIADISYYPEPLFSRIPTITYAGMKCVHPTYQRSDLHSSLSFPFDNAPQEVVFARWKKDIARLNKIDVAYPVEYPSQWDDPTTETHVCDTSKPLYGWAAYCLLMNGEKAKLKTSFKLNGTKITFHTKNGMEYASCDPHDGEKYAKYVGLAPARVVIGEITFWDTSNRLLSIVSIRMGALDIKCACAQSILQYMLSRWFLHEDSAALAAYCSLWEKVKENSSDPTSKFRLSLETYGDKNIDSSQLIQLARQENRLEGIPNNYHPGGKPAPIFDYRGEHYRVSGERID